MRAATFGGFVKFSVIWAVFMLLIFGAFVSLARADVIDFEGLGVEGDTLHSVSGVSFENAILATELSGRIYAFFYGISTRGWDDAVVDGTVPVGGTMLTDKWGDHTPYPFLIGKQVSWTYEKPVTSTSFYLIDVDAHERYVVEAITVSGEVLEKVIADGDPGTGDGKAVKMEFISSMDPIKSVKITPPSWSGWAVDHIEFEPVPAPATVVLMLAGVVAVTAYRKVSR